MPVRSWGGRCLSWLNIASVGLTRDNKIAVSHGCSGGTRCAWGGAK